MTPLYFNTPEEKSQYFRKLQKKSRKTYKGTGGFHYMQKNDPEKLREIAIKGGKIGGKSKKSRVD